MKETLRDKIAIAAMQAMLSNDALIQGITNRKENKKITLADAISDHAYFQADSMLKIRNKDNG